jgi:hypothetical protein
LPVSTIMFKAAGMASKITVRAFQIGSMATSRSMTDGVTIGNQVVKWTNTSRNWKLRFETSANATLMKRLGMQIQHLQHRSCALIWSTKYMDLDVGPMTKLADILSEETQPFDRSESFIGSDSSAMLRPLSRS